MAPVHRAECQRERFIKEDLGDLSPPSTQLSTEERIYVRKVPRQRKSQRKGLKKSVSGIHTDLETGPVPSNPDYKKVFKRVLPQQYYKFSLKHCVDTI